MRVFDCGSPGYFINVILNGFLHTAHITCAGQYKRHKTDTTLHTSKTWQSSRTSELIHWWILFI